MKWALIEGKAYCIFTEMKLDIFLTNRWLVGSKREPRDGTGLLSWRPRLLETACSRSCFHPRWRQRLDLVRTSDTVHLQWNLTRIQRRRQLLRGGTYSINSTAGGGTQGQDREKTERKQNNKKLEHHNKKKLTSVNLPIFGALFTISYKYIDQEICKWNEPDQVHSLMNFT